MNTLISYLCAIAVVALWISLASILSFGVSITYFFSGYLFSAVRIHINQFLDERNPED